MLTILHVTRLFVVFSACFSSMLFSVSIATAASPWQLVNFTKIEADPNKTYDLTDKNGPWMIMVATFTGDGAESDAHNLVLDLRKNHKLNAYYYAKTYDFTERMTGLGFTPEGQPKRMRNATSKKINEAAVLIGDYSRVDDPEAQTTLKKVKAIRPESLKTSQSLAFAEYRQEIQQSLNKERGPLARAFVGTNPLIPSEYFNPKGVDKFVLDLNQDVENSLLNCPGKYSVLVATFKGVVVIDQAKIKDVQAGQGFKSQLDKAADKAHQLTVALRKLGYEAYEFHDRDASLVTVGSFEFVGTPREDGKTEINPTIHKIMQTFGGTPAEATTLPGQPTATGIKPKKVDGIQLDIQPLPVQVPKRSVTSAYVRREN